MRRSPTVTSRRSYLLIALALVGVSVAAIVVAAGTDPGEIASVGEIGEGGEDLPVHAETVPGVAGGKGWLNTEAYGGALADADIEGKVVVYDFWTYSCVNCVRTIPHLRSWWERYADDGLVLVGVHSPEFEFEKDHGNVAAAVDDLEVSWPVVFDDDMAIWNAFANRYWPAKYVTDRDGRLRYFHFGEGQYDETEDVLRALLGVDADSPRADGVVAAGSRFLPDQSPETYLGTLRSGESPQHDEYVDGAGTFALPDDVDLNRFALGGEWIVDGESATTGVDGGVLETRFWGAEVNLVMEVHDEPVPVRVLLDGVAVGDAAAADVDEGVVLVDEARMYGLVRLDEPGEHVLRLEVDEPGLSAFAFTYGS